MQNFQLKDHSLLMLKSQNKWGESIGVVIVYTLISSIPFAGIIIAGPMLFGLTAYFLKLSRNENPTFNDLFSGFQNFGNTFLAFLLTTIITIIGLVFLIIPGIVLALGYSQTMKVLYDNPTMSCTEAMQKSWDIMKGRKWEFFVLAFSFIGWILLGALACGLGIFVLYPYMFTTFSKYYDEITNRKNLEIENIGQL